LQRGKKKKPPKPGTDPSAIAPKKESVLGKKRGKKIGLLTSKKKKSVICPGHVEKNFAQRKKTPATEKKGTRRGGRGHSRVGKNSVRAREETLRRDGRKRKSARPLRKPAGQYHAQVRKEGREEYKITKKRTFRKEKKRKSQENRPEDEDEGDAGVTTEGGKIRSRKKRRKPRKKTPN